MPRSNRHPVAWAGYIIYALRTGWNASLSHVVVFFILGLRSLLLMS